MSPSQLAYCGDCVALSARHGLTANDSDGNSSDHGPNYDDDRGFEADVRLNFVLSNTDSAEHAEVTCLAGYFTAELYGGIDIDTRVDSPARNTFHWESFLLPLRVPIRAAPGATVAVRLRRRCAVDRLPGPRHRLWYEWAAAATESAGAGQQDDWDWMNLDGSSHHLSLWTDSPPAAAANTAEAAAAVTCAADAVHSEVDSEEADSACHGCPCREPPQQK